MIDRADQIIDLREMKWSSSEFVIDKDYDRRLRERSETFTQETGTRKGVRRNTYRDTIQTQVTAEHLFEDAVSFRLADL